MSRKLAVCIGIFLSLFTGIFILDIREEHSMARQGTAGPEPGVLRIHQSGLDDVEISKEYIPFKAREYVRIVPK